MNIHEIIWKQRWGEVEGRIAVAAWRRSGLSAAKFAEKHGLDAMRILRWAKRLERGEDGGEAVPGFAPVAVRGLGEGEAREVELVMTSGVVVRVPRSMPVQWLAEVVKALEGERC